MWQVEQVNESAMEWETVRSFVLYKQAKDYLFQLADERFGKGQWRARPNGSVIGFYVVSKVGGVCLRMS